MHDAAIVARPIVASSQATKESLSQLDGVSSDLPSKLSNLLPPITTMTATTMIAARAPVESVNAPFCAPAAPASLGSDGLSSPPLY
jgi:hypothetical protein